MFSAVTSREIKGYSHNVQGFSQFIHLIDSLPLQQCGPGACPAARLWRPQPARAQPQTRQDQGERLCHPMQSYNRRPSQRLPTRHWKDWGRVYLNGLKACTLSVVVLEASLSNSESGEYIQHIYFRVGFKWSKGQKDKNNIPYMIWVQHFKWSPSPFLQITA